MMKIDFLQKDTSVEITASDDSVIRGVLSSIEETGVYFKRELLANGCEMAFERMPFHKISRIDFIDKNQQVIGMLRISKGEKVFYI